MKTNHAQPNPNSDPNDPQLRPTIFEGLLAEGYIVPETPEEFAIAEAEPSKDELPLPAALDDPAAVLRRIQERIANADAKTVPFPLPQAPGVDEELSRAARHGGKFSVEVKAKMAKNRREADRKRKLDAGK